MSLGSALVWFRNDLRTLDNPALLEAARYVRTARTTGGNAVLKGIIIIVPYELNKVRQWGFAKTDYYLQSVRALRLKIEALKVPLIVKVSKENFTSEDQLNDHIACVLANTAKEQGCDAVFYNHEYEGTSIKRDSAVSKKLEQASIVQHVTHDQCVVPVGRLTTKSTGTPFKIFSQFKKSWAAYIVEHGVGISDTIALQQCETHQSNAIPEAKDFFETGDLSHLNLDSIRQAFPAGEDAAMARLKTFLAKHVSNYDTDRNEASEDGASRLSAPLAVGAISLRLCLSEALSRNGGKLTSGANGVVKWIGELCWRDFYRHVLFSFPHVGQGYSFKPEFQNLPWRAWPEGANSQDEADFKKWIQGHTGVPIVDAAMRQLHREAWLPNRTRMIVAMFLTKDLLIHWRRGEQSFARQLIDYDFASNNGGWQWSASTGTDSQPYFRIFNPVLQSEKFTPDGSYIRRYVSELNSIPAPLIHDPSNRCEQGLLKKTGYPLAMVDHKEVKIKVLAIFTALSKNSSKKRENDE